MDHQLFETWIFSDQPLEPEQRQALQDHLSSCDSCQRLAEGWRMVEGRLQSSELVIPELGFVKRWETRLERHRRRIERRQSFLTMGLLTLSTTVLFLLWVAQASTTFDSLTQLTMIAADQVATVFSLINAFAGVLGTVARTFPAAFYFTLWMGLASLGLMSTLWVISMHRLTFQRRLI